MARTGGFAVYTPGDKLYSAIRPSAGQLSNGNMAVTYHALTCSTSPDVAGQEIDSSGGKVGSQFWPKLASSWHGYAKIVGLPNGTALVSWFHDADGGATGVAGISGMVLNPGEASSDDYETSNETASDGPANTSCGFALVYYCLGNYIDEFVTQVMMGDGFCMEADEINLNCSEFNNDGGDC